MVSFAEWSVDVPHCRSFTISHSAVVIAEQRGSAIAFLGVVRGCSGSSNTAARRDQEGELRLETAFLSC